MLRSKHGRDKLFSTPELLWEAACEYFQWCDENPWLSKKAVQKTVPVKRKKGKKVETVNEQQVQQEVSPTSRPYSLTGFCIYVGASSKWWSTFRTECKNKNDEDFLEVIARVEETLLRLSQLVTDYPIVQELDINPLMISNTTGEAIAVDGRIKLA